MTRAPMLHTGLEQKCTLPARYMNATPKELTFKNWSWVGDASEAYGRRKHKIPL